MMDKSDSRTTKKIELNSSRFKDFLNSLNQSDFVAVKASSNTFWFYDLIKPLVAECFVINPSKLLQVFKTNKKKAGGNVRPSPQIKCINQFCFSTL